MLKSVNVGYCMILIYTFVASGFIEKYPDAILISNCLKV